MAPTAPPAVLPPGPRVIGLEAERFLAAYGIRFPAGGVARDADEAARIAGEIGYPVVLKIVAAAWLHKSDRGGVLLDQRDEATLREGVAKLLRRFHEQTPDVALEGIQVQRLARGAELLLGIKRDPQFGPVVVCGLGGIHTEVLRDFSHELAPLGRDDAARMLDRLRGAPLLEGARGKPAADREAILDTIEALSSIAIAHPEIQELDLNPCMASETGCVAVDARIVRV